MPESFEDRVGELFEEGLALPDEERRTWLDRRAETEPEVAAEVRSLLASHARADGFLEAPAFAPLLDKGASEPCPRQLGPYQVLEVLGSGGMGTVYRAMLEDPPRHVALKVLNQPAFEGSDRRSRFEREARTLAALQHPGIATLLDAGTFDGGVPFIAMELVEGDHLDEWMRAHSPSPTRILETFVELCTAVEHAHAAGILHRDLKPGNVRIREESGRVFVKVLDFGLATPVHAGADTHLTRSGALVGTVSYASPEQALGKLDEVGPASDVYSLGVMLYECLVGSLPYDARGGSLLDSVRVIEREPPRRPSEARPQLRGDLETILLKCLEKEPPRRYASVGALRSDLQLWLEGRPILARPSSPAYRLRKLVERHRLAFTAAVLLFTTVTVAAAALSVLYLDARASRTLAEEEARRSREVNAFLRGTLSLADPSVAGVPELSMAELLDRTAERVDRELESNDRVAAEVRFAIGEAYAGLGRHREADMQLRRALTTMRAVLPAGDPQIARCLLTLGRVEMSRGRPGPAEDLLRESAAAFEATEELAPLTEDRVDARLNLSRALRTKSGTPERFEEIDELLRESSAILAAHPEHAGEAVRARLAEERAAYLGEIGSFEEAEVELRRALKHLERSSCAPVKLATCLNSLGVCLGRLRRGDEAEAAYRQAHELLLRDFGAEHPRVTAVLDNLGDQVTRNGRAQEGEELLREALVARETTLPAGHPDIAVTLNHLGHSLRAQGQLALAKEVYEHAYVINLDALGERHMETASTSASLAQIHLDLHDFAGAEEHARRMLDGYYEGLPEDHWLLGAGLELLGRALLALGRSEDALPVLQDAARITSDAFGSEDSRAVSLRVLVSRAESSANR